MSAHDEHSQARYSSEELDEAAVWMARLRAPDRTESLEAGFRRWLTEKPSHAAAFETISNAWELTGALERRPFPRLTRWERAGFRSGFLRATAAVVVASLCIAVGIAFYVRSSGVATQLGEQRVLTLEDGSRISLNTASRVVVKYDSNARHVELKEGEALFEVEKRPDWPFIVTAAGRRIQALGTSFVVREDEGRLAVTLIEGKVEVSSPDAAKASAPDRDPSDMPRDIFILEPGQRLTLASDSTPRIDEPRIEKMTAWRRGQVEFDDTVLATAAQEMNRYSPVQLIIESSAANELRINGVFRAGDNAGFAAALARSYGFTMEQNEQHIVLSGVPRQ